MVDFPTRKLSPRAPWPIQLARQICDCRSCSTKSGFFDLKSKSYITTSDDTPCVQVCHTLDEVYLWNEYLLEEEEKLEKLEKSRQAAAEAERIARQFQLELEKPGPEIVIGQPVYTEDEIKAWNKRQLFQPKGCSVNLQREEYLLEEKRAKDIQKQMRNLLRSDKKRAKARANHRAEAQVSKTSLPAPPIAVVSPLSVIVEDSQLTPEQQSSIRVYKKSPTTTSTSPVERASKPPVRKGKSVLSLKEFWEYEPPITDQTDQTEPVQTASEVSLSSDALSSTQSMSSSTDVSWIMVVKKNLPQKPVEPPVPPAPAATPSKLKTRLCVSVTTLGKSCPHGDRCTFAHSLEDLHIRPCMNGNRCWFMHTSCLEAGCNPSSKVCQFLHPDESKERFAERTGLTCIVSASKPILPAKSRRKPAAPIPTPPLEAILPVKEMDEPNPPPPLVQAEEHEPDPPPVVPRLKIERVVVEEVETEIPLTLSPPPSLPQPLPKPPLKETPFASRYRPPDPSELPLPSKRLLEKPVLIAVPRDMAIPMTQMLLQRGIKNIRIEIIE